MNATPFDSMRAPRVLGLGVLAGIGAGLCVFVSHCHGSMPARPLASGSAPPGPHFKVATLDLRLIGVPAQDFTMGTPGARGARDPAHDTRDEPAHRVSISRPFAIGATEITRAQWLTVMGFPAWPIDAKSPLLPASHVSWGYAVWFCERLTMLERKAGNLPHDRVYRLPTEAEWELACRAGSTRDYACGDVTQLPSFAVYEQTAVALADCGQRSANAWGLYDVHGNVWEWCADACHVDERDHRITVSTSTYRDDVRDPCERQGDARILRGGGFNNSAPYLRAANRHALPPDTLNTAVGFRVVLGAALR